MNKQGERGKVPQGVVVWVGGVSSLIPHAMPCNTASLHTATCVSLFPTLHHTTPRHTTVLPNSGSNSNLATLTCLRSPEVRLAEWVKLIRCPCCPCCCTWP